MAENNKAENFGDSSTEDKLIVGLSEAVGIVLGVALFAGIMMYYAKNEKLFKDI